MVPISEAPSAPRAGRDVRAFHIGFNRVKMSFIASGLLVGVMDLQGLDCAELGFHAAAVRAIVAVGSDLCLAFDRGKEPSFDRAEANALTLHIGEQGEGIEAAGAAGVRFHDFGVYS